MEMVHASLLIRNKLYIVGRIERPTTAQGERITPSDLRDHRRSHKFLGPCCVCPLIADDQTAFKEAAIFAVASGRFVGEYVAECAESRCGYFGK